MTDRRRPRGRPRLDEHDTSTDLTVRIPSRQFDAADACARRERVTLPELVRTALRKHLANLSPTK